MELIEGRAALLVIDMQNDFCDPRVGTYAPGAEEIGVYEVYVHAARDPQLYPVLQECFAAYDEVATSALRALGVPSAAELAPHVVALVAGAQLRRLATGASHSGLAGALLLLTTGPGQTPAGPG